MTHRMIRNIAWLLGGSLLLASHALLGAELPFAALLESSAGRYLFEQTIPGTELVAKVAGNEAGLLEGHIRLEKALQKSELSQLSDELGLRLNRVRERFAQRYPFRERAVFENSAPLSAAESEYLNVLAADELRAWNYDFVGNTGGNGQPGQLIYSSARNVFLGGADLHAKLIVGEADLGTVETLSPESDLFKFHVVRVRALTQWNEFPQVAPELLHNQAPLVAGGMGNKGMLRASLEDGREVIVKLSNPATRSKEQLLQEARMCMILNKLGLGPKFHGLISFANGDYGLVTDYVSGTPFPKAKGGVPMSFKLQESHAEEILATGRTLIRAGIVSAHDLQFILNAEGHAVVIDPEFLDFRAPPIAIEEMPTDPIVITEKYADNLRWELKMREAAKPKQLIIVPTAPAKAPEELPPEFRNVNVPLIGKH